MPFYSTLKSLLNEHIFDMTYFSGHTLKCCCQSYQQVELYSHLSCIPNDKDTVVEYCIKAAYGCRLEYCLYG